MPYTIEYLHDEKIVLVTNTGLFTFDDFLMQTKEALDFGTDIQCSCYLVDCTAMTIKASTMDIFSSPGVYDTLDAPRTNKVALLAKYGTGVDSDLHFYETVCHNRGWQVRIFLAKHDAIRWLQNKPTS